MRTRFYLAVIAWGCQGIANLYGVDFPMRLNVPTPHNGVALDHVFQPQRAGCLTHWLRLLAYVLGILIVLAWCSHR